MPPLELLLSDINKSFGDMFAKMGCAGEIKLDRGDTEVSCNLVTRIMRNGFSLRSIVFILRASILSSINHTF